jgi:hypothetical protein
MYKKKIFLISLKQNNMPTSAYTKTWGCTKPFMPVQIIQNKIEEKKPVLSTKSISTDTQTIEIPIQVPPQKEVKQIQVQKEKSIPLWLVIVLGVGCGIFFLWAVVATVTAQRVLRNHSTMLQNLILLASKYVKKSFESGAAVAPPAPRNLNLEELLKSLQ